MSLWVAIGGYYDFKRLLKKLEVRDGEGSCFVYTEISHMDIHNR